MTFNSIYDDDDFTTHLVLILRKEDNISKVIRRMEETVNRIEERLDRTYLPLY